MSQVTPLQLDNGSVIYIEAAEGVEMPDLAEESESRPVKRGIEDIQAQVIEGALSVSDTISAYSNYALSAIRQIAVANVEEITLQFGVEVGGEAGIPYITKGSAKGNLNITVKCTFPSNEQSGSSTEQAGSSNVEGVHTD